METKGRRAVKKEHMKELLIVVEKARNRAK